MTFHREGYPSILITLLVVAVLNLAGHYLAPETAWLHWIIYALSAFLILVILQFFRSPNRTTVINDNHLIAPADGKVVVIEEVEEPEYFKDKRLQVSIFMSPINVHVNRYPIGGQVSYVKYHPGKYLVAWHPKASTDNERSTLVVKGTKGEVLFRQIAGALARRIVFYPKVGDKAVQGQEFGFIKFGSRVDIFLPLGTKVDVGLNQVVTGGETVIARFEA